MADIDKADAGDSWPRWINIVAGAWLFISAFVWVHTQGMMTDTWIVGALMFLCAIAALFAPAVRYANTVLAIWLFISTLVIHHETVGTLWNNIIVAIVVFIVSLIPSGAATVGGYGRRTLPAT